MSISLHEEILDMFIINAVENLLTFTPRRNKAEMPQEPQLM